MKLTRTERWILANQYRILAALTPHRTEEYETCIEALENGYQGYIDRLAESIYDGRDIVNDQDTSFVLKTMSMYEALQRSLQSLGSARDITADKVRFSGFDGNNETALMGYARFVVEREHRFTYLDKVHDLNSHMPSVDIYQRMLEVWENMGEPYEMTEEQMKQVLGARIHPSNR